MTADKWITLAIALVGLALGVVRPIYLEIDALEVKAKADVKELRGQLKEDEALIAKLGERMTIIERDFECRK